MGAESLGELGVTVCNPIGDANLGRAIAVDRTRGAVVQSDRLGRCEHLGGVERADDDGVRVLIVLGEACTVCTQAFAQGLQQELSRGEIGRFGGSDQVERPVAGGGGVSWKLEGPKIDSCVSHSATVKPARLIPVRLSVSTHSKRVKPGSLRSVRQRFGRRARTEQQHFRRGVRKTGTIAEEPAAGSVPDSQAETLRTPRRDPVRSAPRDDAHRAPCGPPRRGAARGRGDELRRHRHGGAARGGHARGGRARCELVGDVAPVHDRVCSWSSRLRLRISRAHDGTARWRGT